MTACYRYYEALLGSAYIHFGHIHRGWGWRGTDNTGRFCLRATETDRRNVPMQSICGIVFVSPVTMNRRCTPTSYICRLHAQVHYDHRNMSVLLIGLYSPLYCTMSVNLTNPRLINAARDYNKQPMYRLL